ncbi:MAG: precorrin-6A reductase [Butyricicoccus sp.]|nr:precorrin-6A reductase [Butyricicoccus sp.]
MRLLIFSGTSEGHAICRFLSQHGATADAFVATEYGEAVMEPLPGITVHQGRLDTNQMAAYMGPDTLVVDATHPYAHAVTENIRAACAQAGAEYQRLLRPRTEAQGVVTIPDTAHAVTWLGEHPGKVLLTTGSKELDAYTAVPDFKDRLYPRVLPTASVLQKCEALGFPGAHIIAMQGPFSKEFNVALLQQTGASILVTKDTGKSGGFAEKLAAARETGAMVLMIARPSEEEGKSLEQMQDELQARLSLKQAPSCPRFPLFVSLKGKKVLIVGAGQIAARRIGVLQRFSAAVQVIATEKRADIGLPVEQRAFIESDVDGAALVVAATDDRAVNHRVFVACQARGIPVSVADCAAESTFFFPAICEGKGMVAGLVSGGRDHHAVSAMAKRIRALMEE